MGAIRSTVCIAGHACVIQGTKKTGSFSVQFSMREQVIRPQTCASLLSQLLADDRNRFGDLVVLTAGCQGLWDSRSSAFHLFS